ncbi:ComC/BlpC family leader-containing pheromone/bacteriocin [Fructobacillus sp. W13]|uniref:ComC/BlpC family leader-containing pheromone/bacteriocin n=1 Tax=Fructobacillus apis TaxID=2935017 RepID=A0ABT0ZRF6_9LACO|nr:ComC/BlpC family leader-containing pheromone/bacteriocin [Fructobacillus apis]MCO0832572.1 ComC/BlpC family leader-containing pheromone/bacteriocin [Fructobacillus apis]
MNELNNFKTLSNSELELVHGGHCIGLIKKGFGFAFDFVDSFARGMLETVFKK